ncbi:mitochondrial distribution and morphology protein 10 [Cryptococcus neoformans Bt1]|nr:mitochondrial distribution and morphology protein 10 [Cryptococcus neoformans var. grubii Bt1]OXG11610.1 mitochondrial distribution and morphology protein 10 [Cryptococcus neoformans var. grubii Ze90-1]
MIGFSAFILRNYYAAIGWNEDNLYSSLTRASSALLDFQLPQSLILQLANSPTPIFFTSYALDALPQLNGSISYITTSMPLDEIGSGRAIAFKTVVERFTVFPPPRRPQPKDEIWRGGKRIEGRDYLLYSRLHLPSLHLSGLATTRLTPTLQAHLAFLSQPAHPTSARPTPPQTPSHTRQPSEPSTPAPSPTPGNVFISLQHDTGRYCGEYTYSVQDGMVGLRTLYNFGWHGDEESEVDKKERREREGKRIDEEEMMEGGLKGRFSAGGEVYFSAKQRSFGISTGLRFTTVPPTLPLPPNAPVPSPPTTLTLLYNPLIGFLSSAYSAQVSPTVALATRFGVNVYSYESDLSVGGEWWIGRRRGKRGLTKDAESQLDAESRDPVATGIEENRELAEKMAQRASLREVTLRDEVVEDGNAEKELDSPIPVMADVSAGELQQQAMPRSQQQQDLDDERDGVLKARLSGNWQFALLYEARIRNCLVSAGVLADLTGRQHPIKSIGLEVQYFS